MEKEGSKGRKKERWCVCACVCVCVCVCVCDCVCDIIITHKSGSYSSFLSPLSSITFPPLHFFISSHFVYGANLYTQQDHRGESPIAFDDPPRPPRPRGHVIACRITAENPDEVSVGLVRFILSLSIYFFISPFYMQNGARV